MKKGLTFSAFYTGLFTNQSIALNLLVIRGDKGAKELPRGKSERVKGGQWCG